MFTAYMRVVPTWRTRVYRKTGNLLPLKKYRRRGRSEMKRLTDYLWDGLNLDRFAVVAIWPQNAREAAILMRSQYPAADPAPWCVEYRGSGRYFKTAGEAMDYSAARGFKMEIPV